jgi:hypothetical protein
MRLVIYAQGDTLQSSGRLSAWEATAEVSLLGFDELASELARLKRGHPSNLIQSFPRRISFLPTMKVGLMAGCALRLLTAVLDLRWCSARAENLREQARVGQALHRQEDHLLANRRKIESLPAPPGVSSALALDALEQVGAALPVPLCLKSIDVQASGLVTLGGLCPFGRLSVQDLTRALLAAGLIRAKVRANAGSDEWTATGQIPGGNHDH